mmetsp:Transcript_29467/g.69249  ORF Transcript_29467/g.69249 Transcript_29467/m.69249 type:complete len:128 (-) Transcript_29467:30-413(-)
MFKEGDPRASLVVARVDPRLHFALVCGAKSCPPIRIFVAENVDTALGIAARSFIGSEVKVDGATVTASKIFQWYGVDFGATPLEIVEWISHHCREEQAQPLHDALASPDFKLAFSDYDWQLNAAAKL